MIECQGKFYGRHWKRRVCIAYIRIVKDMYDVAITSVRTYGGMIEDFLIKINLHQGSSLSPYLLTLVLDGCTY